jgi:hypothetical protein
MPLDEWSIRDELLSDALHMRDVAMGLAPIGCPLPTWAADHDEEYDEDRPAWAAGATHGELVDYDFMVRESRKPVLGSDDKAPAYSADAHARTTLLQSRFTDGKAAQCWIEYEDAADAFAIIEDVRADYIGTVDEWTDQAHYEAQIRQVQMHPEPVALDPRRPRDKGRAKGTLRKEGGSPHPSNGRGGMAWPPQSPVALKSKAQMPVWPERGRGSVATSTPWSRHERDWCVETGLVDLIGQCCRTVGPAAHHHLREMALNLALPEMLAAFERTERSKRDRSPVAVRRHERQKRLAELRMDLDIAARMGLWDCWLYASMEYDELVGEPA